MAGYIKEGTSLANGIPARHIGPETGSSGNATVTNKGGTSEGSNEAADSRPAGAAGIEGFTNTNDVKEERSFQPDQAADTGPFPVTDAETAAQQIADGGDRRDHEKHLSDKH